MGWSAQPFVGTQREAAGQALEKELGRLSGPRPVPSGYLGPAGERLIAAALHGGTRSLA